MAQRPEKPLVPQIPASLILFNIGKCTRNPLEGSIDITIDSYTTFILGAVFFIPDITDASCSGTSSFTLGLETKSSCVIIFSRNRKKRIRHYTAHTATADSAPQRHQGISK